MNRITKNILKKLVGDENGQAFILVLILLAIGGLIITPLLDYMSTGLKAGQMHEARMEEIYAADAGVEDALYKIVNGDVLLPQNLGESYPYDLEDESGNLRYINGNSVHVEIVLEETLYEFLENLLGGDAGVHEEWAVTTDEEQPEGEYTIIIQYMGAAANKKISGVGAWFRGEYQYNGVMDVQIELGDPPVLFDPMTITHPNWSYDVIPYRGGTAFIFEWLPGDKPEFGFQPDIYDGFVRFKYLPEITPALYVGWVDVGSEDIGVIPTAVTFGTYKIIATATDSITGEQTEAVAYPSWQSISEITAVDILAWDVNLQ